MFPAKLLLFGEYTVMHGSMALAVPFPRFSGKWNIRENENGAVDQKILETYSIYLKKEESKFIFNINISDFKKDIEKGLYFDSSVPVGYGVGSSGAFCAAFYARYAVTPIPPSCPDTMLPVLRKHLSLLESYFHGQSSGIDPLVSYTNSPILIHNNGNLKRIPHYNPVKISMFLLDTGGLGNTLGNVNIFKEMMEEDYYAATIKNHFIPIVNKCIHQFIKGDDFFSTVTSLSLQQQALFEPMIPLHFMKYFQKDESDGDYVLKLCGSGGGGFLLGFTRQIDKIADYFSAEGLNIIIV